MGLFKRAPPPPPPPSGFYVPFNQIKPLLSADRKEPGVFIWQAFPWLKNFYFNWEMNYADVPHIQDVVHDNWKAPFIVLAIYAVVIIGGRRIMRDRPAFDLKTPLAAWNLFLAAFSFMGVIRTVPYLLWYLAGNNLSFRDINCLPTSYTHGQRDIGLWVMLFIFSKFFELIDTVFIVLRKKPLLFLHWYHHVTVLLFCYFSSGHRHPGLFFVCMNYSVHAVMYFYFYLMAIKKVPQWFNPLWITIAQISQMVGGVYVTAATWYMKTHGGGCDAAKFPLLYGSAAMYGSYMYLFVEFAVLRFIIAPRKRQQKLAALGKTDSTPPPPTVASVLRKVSSIVTGAAPEPTEVDDQGVPTLKPYFTPQTSAYSFHVAMDGVVEEEVDEDRPVHAARKASTTSRAAAAAAAGSKKKR